MTLTQLLFDDYPMVFNEERKNAISLIVSKEIKTILPDLKLTKVKEVSWEVIDYPNELVLVIKGIIDRSIAEGI